MTAQALPSGAMAQTANPQWTVPPGWDLGSASSVRRGSFLVKDANGQTADIAVTVFPGDVGGRAMNINRWRGQVGLAPAQPDEIAKLTETVDVNGTPATLVDFAGTTPPAGKTQPQRMIVVTLPHAGNSWFFKVTGDAPLVTAQKPALLAFVKSVNF